MNTRAEHSFKVVTFFHELGHGIHDLVGKTLYSRFHGTNTVNDFVEAPSQMLENWCWTPSQLKFLSQHYSSLSPTYLATWKESASGQKEPEAKIPDDLIKSLIETKHVNEALFTLRQLHFGIFDMAIHEPKSHDEAEKMDITAMFNNFRTEITALEGPEALGMGSHWGHGQATFGHLMGKFFPTDVSVLSLNSIRWLRRWLLWLSGFPGLLRRYVPQRLCKGPHECCGRAKISPYGS